MSAADTLASIRAKAAARQRVFYERHKVRLLADRKEGYRLVKAQREPAEPVANHYPDEDDVEDNEYPDVDPGDYQHDYPNEPPIAAVRRAKRVKYNEADATAAIKLINENYPNKVRKASSIKSYANGVKRLFKDLAPCVDLWARFSKPKLVIKKLQERVDAGEAALSSTTTLITIIMVLFDHLPNFNLADEHKNEFRQAADYYAALTKANNLRLKASALYNVMPWPDYLQRIDEKYPEGSIQRLVAKMYHEVPVRDDFKELRIVEKKTEMNDINMNYLVLSRTEAVIVLNAYKTEKKFRGLKLPPYKLSPGLSSMLRDYIKEHKLPYGQFLFPKFQTSGLSSMVGKMNKACGIQKLAVNALRSMTIATEGYNNRDLPEAERSKLRIKLATRMLHNSITAEAYNRGFIAAED